MYIISNFMLTTKHIIGFFFIKYKYVLTHQLKLVTSQGLGCKGLGRKVISTRIFIPFLRRRPLALVRM
jgi:hypothetical protein